MLHSHVQGNRVNESNKAQFAGANKWWWLWLLGGALYGIFLRVFFGLIPDTYGDEMSAAFLIGTPFVIGALTVYGGRHRNQSWLFSIVSPWLAVLLMLLGCAITMLEGSICLAIMSPLFFLFSSIGGFLMWLALKLVKRNQSRLGAVAILPFLLLAGENQVPLSEQQMVLTQSVLIDAAPHTVWTQIMQARSIQANELPFSLTHFIGVPKPIEGINLETPNGEIRYSKWERGVNFRALVTKRKEDISISWKYIFDENSFPAGSMDDHVAIGGRYFNLNDTTFNLHSLPGNKTRLEIVAHYRVTSSINFYALPAAKFIGNDFISTILGLYKGRSEKAEELVTRPHSSR